MTEKVGFSEAPGRTPSPGQIVARIGIASLLAALQPVEFVAGQTGLVDSIGHGPLAAVTRRALRHGEQNCIAMLAEVDALGEISDVTQDGAGPLITCAAIAATDQRIAGPWFGFPNLKMTVVRSGALGLARMEFSFDGITPYETVDLSPELPATLISVDLTTIDLSALNTQTLIVNPDSVGNKTTTFSGLTAIGDIVTQVDASLKEAATLLGSADLSAYTPSTINGKTLIFTDINGDGALTITFAAVSVLADIATQIAAGAGITAALASNHVRITSDVLGNDSHLLLGNGTANSDLGFSNLDEDDGAEYGAASLVGGKYLKIVGLTLGSTGTLDVGAGTANEELGFTEGRVNGTNSTYDLPGVGIRITFPDGDYVEDTTYQLATTAPTMGIPEFETAAAALRADGAEFSILHVVHEPIDGIDLLAWQTALENFRVECATAEDNPIFFKWILGGPMAPIGDWGDVDQDVKASLANTQEANKFNTIVHGDIFVEWEEYGGRHRTQLAVTYAEECARNALNVNPGFGGKGALRKAYLKDLWGNKIRTEAEALLKLEEQGFSVARDEKGEPFIRAGRTRAPKTSQFTGEHTARAALECARVMRERAFKFSNDTPNLAVGGALSQDDKSTIEGAFNEDLSETIVKRGYASSAKAIITGFESTGGADKVFVKGVFQRLASLKDLDITVFVTNDVTIVEGIA